MRTDCLQLRRVETCFIAVRRLLSHCGGFFCCGPQGSRLWASVVVMHGLSCPRHMESSWTGERTCVPCICRWTLNHWTVGISVQQTEAEGLLQALGSPQQPINRPSHGCVRAFGGPEVSVDVGAERGHGLGSQDTGCEAWIYHLRLWANGFTLLEPLLFICYVKIIELTSSF